MSAPALSKRRIPLLRLVALFAAFGLLVAACGDDDSNADGDGSSPSGAATADGLLGELQSAGTIKVGIANEVPYGFEDEDGNVTGEAPEVARAVFAELGVEDIEATVVDFGSLISGLQAGQFDMIAAGMYINADRAEQILFSDPDYCVGEAFAVPEGNPEGLTDFESVVDNGSVKIAILEGAVEIGYADAAGVPDSQVEVFADVNAQYDALEAGRVDAVTGTYLTVKQQTDVLDGFETTESFVPLDENGDEVLGCGGFGFRMEDQDLRDAFNDKLNELQEGDRLVEIITGFGFAEEDVLLAQDLTVEDLTS
ncbi:ectoine/hydroxyectoine ABC transporter substrate-binding protein EhuB [Actinospongicola halichondriae]|uniref:ectoine/hydroxyectoine ABC transporter substrate-binding protein EhuB n=1 Tax=Actinospongicola halichondriae TaxID=3236844 RepID=UPI003D539612